MKSFSMWASSAEDTGEAQEELPPTIHMPDCDRPAALSSWRIVDAGGGFQGRYKHLLLLHAPTSGEIDVATAHQISLPEQDEWGPATGAFYLREPEGGAFKISEDGTRAEDA